MDYSELLESAGRQPSLKNLTQVDYGIPKPEQNKVLLAFYIHLIGDTKHIRQRGRDPGTVWARATPCGDTASPAYNV